MKEGFDKDIDSLLRRHAGGAAGLRVDGGGERAHGAASHLDADELSAFAEGALPAAARVAAVSHLAECDECRGVAVGLARASGFEVASERSAAAASAAAAVTGAPVVAGWRAWLSSLFAPRVLRYAAPALALCVVGVVSFVALRSSRNAEPPSTQTALDEVRRVESQKESAAGAAPPVNTATTNANANTDGLLARATVEDTRGAVASSGPVAQPVAPGQGGAGEGQGAPPAPAAPAGAAATQPAPPPAVERTEVASDAPAAKAVPAEEREAEKRAENAPAKADESKYKSAPEPVEVTRNDDYAQKRAQTRAGEVQMPDGARNRAGNNQSNIGGGGLASQPAPKTEDGDSAASRARAARRGRAMQSERSDATARAGETRSAAGHRFRREGGVWVDVNYRSSMPSTGVRRGTEPFRALVADLPEIGRVAEQLGGEVVVVVRGRAYRIR